MFGITYSDGVVSTFLAQPKQLSWFAMILVIFHGSFCETLSDTEIAKDEFEYLHRFMASIQKDIPFNGDGNRSRRRGQCKPALMIGDVI